MPTISAKYDTISPILNNLSTMYVGNDYKPDGTKRSGKVEPHQIDMVNDMIRLFVVVVVVHCASMDIVIYNNSNHLILWSIQSIFLIVIEEIIPHVYEEFAG